MTVAGQVAYRCPYPLRPAGKPLSGSRCPPLPYMNNDTLRISSKSTKTAARCAAVCFSMYTAGIPALCFRAWHVATAPTLPGAESGAPIRSPEIRTSRCLRYPDRITQRGRRARTPSMKASIPSSRISLTSWRLNSFMSRGVGLSAFPRLRFSANSASDLVK